MSRIPFVLWSCTMLGELQVHRADFCCHQNWPSVPQEAYSLSATMTGKEAKLQHGVLRCGGPQATPNPDEGSWAHEFLKYNNWFGGRRGLWVSFLPLWNPCGRLCWFWHQHMGSLCSEAELTCADLQISYFKRLIKYYHCFPSYSCMFFYFFMWEVSPYSKIRVWICFLVPSPFKTWEENNQGNGPRERERRGAETPRPEAKCSLALREWLQLALSEVEPLKHSLSCSWRLESHLQGRF